MGLIFKNRDDELVDMYNGEISILEALLENGHNFRLVVGSLGKKNANESKVNPSRDEEKRVEELVPLIKEKE
jgi:uncharacterized phage-like protein YoqJ